MSRFYKIHTKDDVVLVEAEDKDEAFAKYFKEIIEEKVSIDKIGNLIMLEDEKGEEYAFRTVPILFKMGYLDEEQALATLLSIGVADSKNEARQLLRECAEQDAWVAEKIDALALKEART